MKHSTRFMLLSNEKSSVETKRRAFYNVNISQEQWHTSVIIPLVRLRQKDLHEFKASLRLRLYLKTTKNSNTIRSQMSSLKICCIREKEGGVKHHIVSVSPPGPKEASFEWIPKSLSHTSLSAYLGSYVFSPGDRWVEHRNRKQVLEHRAGNCPSVEETDQKAKTTKWKESATSPQVLLCVAPESVLPNTHRIEGARSLLPVLGISNQLWMCYVLPLKTCELIAVTIHNRISLMILPAFYYFLISD